MEIRKELGEEEDIIKIYFMNMCATKEELKNGGGRGGISSEGSLCNFHSSYFYSNTMKEGQRSLTTGFWSASKQKAPGWV